VGDTITLKVRGRRGGERAVKWKVGNRQEISYQLKDLDNVTDGQRARRAAWLRGEAQTGDDARPGTKAGSGNPASGLPVSATPVSLNP